MSETGTNGSPRGRILIIDDEADIRESLETLLSMEGYQVDEAPTGQEGQKALDRVAYDLVLLDLMLPDKSGMDVLKEVRARDQETPICMITAYGSLEVAVTALKSGAQDYFPKPWDNEKLLIEIDRLIGKKRLERENTQLKRALKQRYSFPNIIGKSDRMMKVLDLVAQVASSRSTTVLITGETGTGKELIAKAIHAHSSRADHAFVASGTLPPDLLESTLFGHVKGAFTGAHATRKGYFEIADHGSIFFDEVGTIGMDIQAKLLRVIQEKEFMPVGSAEKIRVDVRILAATNEDLRKRIEEGKFREDLYYRLNVININLPPLRDRKEDIPALLDHFFDKFCRENEKFLGPDGRSLLKFDAEAMRLLMDHSWPGNIRELENAVERAVVLSTQPVVTADVLPETLLHSQGVRIRQDESVPLPSDASLFEMVADFERRKIVEALDAAGGSQTDAAERLKIPLSTLNQKIKRLNIDVKRRGSQSSPPAP